jgi:hypothetical protein
MTNERRGMAIRWSVCVLLGGNLNVHYKPEEERRLSVKYPLFLSDFNGTCILSTFFFFRKTSQISNFIKICPEGAKFYADGQT